LPAIIGRRELIAALGSVAALPLAARAQQRDRTKRLGVLWGLAENDNVYEPYLLAFKQRLQDFGWIDDRNVRIEYRFTGGVTERIRIAARELVAAAPDVIFATTNPAVAALLQETQTIPIVFTLVSDSIGSGFVPNLAHPGGNITGFHNFEPELSGKWLEILKEVAPEVRRVAFLHHPQTAAHIGFLPMGTAPSSTPRRRQ
jgi:putative ABC transport system substrate-binding protein